MSIVCENIKKDGTNDSGGDGIVVFTIAFDIPDGSPVKKRLQACASNGIDGKGDKLYYDAGARRNSQKPLRRSRVRSRRSASHAKTLGV